MATEDDETFGAWAREWLETSIHLKPRTRVDYEGVLRTRLLPVFGDMAVRDISQRRIRRFMADRIEAGDSPGSARNAFALLRNILNGARGSGLIEVNPCVGVRMPRMVRREMLFLDAAQVLALSRAIADPYGPMVLFAAYTGARAGEIAALRARRIDFDKARVEIRESLADVNGHMIVGPTKTYGTRQLALPPFLVEVLREHVEQQGRSGDDLVFTSRRGQPLRQNVFMARYFKPAVKRAGLPSGLRFHDLRHTCVALLIEQGAHPRAIMERLGHSTIEVTLGRYGHVFPSLDAGVVDGLQRSYEAASRTDSGSGGPRQELASRARGTGEA